jgi:hypothetical protein
MPEKNHETIVIGVKGLPVAGDNKNQEPDQWQITV